MKGHIIRLDQYTEFGKTDTVLLTLAINGTEARRILEDIGEHGLYVASRGLTDALQAIEFGPVAITEYNKNQGD
jgi:hypothetical protein